MALYLGHNLINGVLTTHYTTTLNTTDATAKDLEIFAGKTAYVNGQKVTGTFAPDPSQIKANEVIANVTGTFTNDGTATSGEHIRSGYVAYSKGVKITGTYEGLDTSDATATTSDHIRAGYTAYSKGVKITGTYSGIDTTLSNGATNAQILQGYSAYVNGVKVDGTMQNKGAVSATLEANGTYKIPAGYHNGSGTVTQNLTTQGVKTWTPTTYNQTIYAGTYCSGDQIIEGSSNLIEDNIKSGVKIFGVTGNLSTGYKIQTGAVSGGNSMTISTSFKPAGFMMYMDGSLYFDDDSNLYAAYANGTTSVSTRYSSADEVSGGSYEDPYLSLVIPSFSYRFYSYQLLDDFYLSWLYDTSEGDDWDMSDTDDSNTTLYDWALAGAGSGSSGLDPYSGTGTATATFNASSLVVTVSSSYYVGRTWNYIIWGS